MNSKTSRFMMWAGFVILTSVALMSFLVAIDIGFGYWHLLSEGKRGTNNSPYRADSSLGWVPIPGGTGSHTRPGNFSVEYTIDDRGYRITPRCEDTSQRLFLFGDSYTFGYGVENQETFAWHLANEYLSPRVDVINAGVSGYGVTQMRVRFEQVLTEIQPGDVVAFLPISEDMLRDVYDFSFLGKMLLAGKVQKFPQFRDGRIVNLDITTPAKYVLALFLNARLLGKSFQRLHRTFMHPSSIPDSQAMIEQARAMTQARGARFVLVFLPRIKELLRGHWRADLSSMNFLDIRDQFPSDEDELRLMRFPTELHYTAKGHAHVAAILAKIFAGEGIALRDENDPAPCLPLEEKGQRQGEYPVHGPV